MPSQPGWPRLILNIVRLEAGLCWPRESCMLPCKPAPQTLVYRRLTEWGKPVDRKVYNFWVLKAPYKSGVEKILRGHAAMYPMVSCCDIRRSRDRHSLRVSALRRVLAAHSRSWSKMPARIRSTNHNGFERCHHWSSTCLLSYSYCHEVSHAFETVGSLAIFEQYFKADLSAEKFLWFSFSGFPWSSSASPSTVSSLS